MAGSKEGARKARETVMRRHGEDFYARAGSKSWSNPERSRRTGFAVNPELAIEAGRKGGKKTKNEYKTQKTNKTQKGLYTTPSGHSYQIDFVETKEEIEEVLSILAKAEEDCTGVSE